MYNLLFIFKQSIYILSVVLSSYLLYDDFNLFLSKPTYSSADERILEPENFPGIFLCPLPAYNLSQLQRHGYKSSYNYVIGRMKKKELLNWSGNESFEIEKVANDIAMIKTIKDCPNLTIKYKTIKKYDRVKYELAKSGNPPGQCCRAIIPENAKKDSLKSMYFFIHLSRNPNIEGFQMFLSNQESFHKFKMLQFNTNGILLKAVRKKPGYKVFKIKIHDHVRLEEDPKIQCRNYMYKSDYSKV